MFLAAKRLAFLTQPLAWVALLMLVAVLLVRRRPHQVPCIRPRQTT